jgi:hypothetical protein
MWAKIKGYREFLTDEPDFARMNFSRGQHVWLTLPTGPRTQSSRSTMSPQTLRQTRAAVESGAIRLDGAVVRFTSRKQGSFAISLDEVALIGEYTTDNGPFVDDWFIVFVRKDGNEWFEASMYAEGIAGFLEELSAALGVPLVVGLAASTDFNSRVIWPPAIAGRPLFDSSQVGATGFFHRLRLAILPEKSRHISAQILTAIRPQN